MLFPIISTWMSIEGHRRLFQVIPDPMQELWDKWELRGLILLSLVSQIILTLLGNRTNYKPNICTRALVWSAYLLADWVAALAMGVISSNLGDYYNVTCQKKKVNPQLIAFWAPFFLMHLGGPDTITAYALEDNELWLRHLVGLVSQTILTIYIILMSWKGNWLSHLSILMLVVGFIKYAERTWSLYSGSIKHLRDSFLRSNGNPWNKEQWHDQYQRNFLRFIYIFVSLFADLVLSPRDIDHDREEFLNNIGWEHAFNKVDFELKLMYDVFYTKAFANYGFLGLMSRLITLTGTLIVLVLYAKLSQNNEYLVMDHIITFLLLAGALISEIYAFILSIASKWRRYYFSVSGLEDSLYMYEYNVERDSSSFFGKKAPISFGQSNFFTFICSQNWNTMDNFVPINKLEKLLHVSHCSISSDLKKKIFSSLYLKSERSMQSNFSDNPGSGNCSKGKNMSILLSEFEFHRTIITWHIVTNLFYYQKDGDSSVHSRNSKQISDYMFYLLVKQRYMLPVGSGLITIRDAIIQTVKYFPFVPQEHELAEVCDVLLQQGKPTATIDEPLEVQSILSILFLPETKDGESAKEQSASVLFQACEIAKKLGVGNREKMWQLIEELWVEILSYAGAHGRVDMHAQQLRRGLELISHVWLLQAHFGLLDQFRITPLKANA
ncbi:uncharacterized protein LOC113860084 [Abrus precatorius]|uniref:Uncharacterized protein LOC113860084 n=1 Tax=Abrus precatorius TaxID=3816 RepID=A0A8B8KXB0_ABRPR|nr:uncharacterized protein LOC113860084 [Abrus precatorius]